MFENLTNRLTQAFSGFRGRRLTEENIAKAISEVRAALLEADVALEVVIRFVEAVKKKSVGHEFVAAVRPGDMFITLVHDELVRVMGSNSSGLNLKGEQNPAIILMAGLQGTGKTTSAAKLANFLKSRENLKVATVSADVYRPAAIEQLRVLSSEVGVHFIESKESETPETIARRAQREAADQSMDVLIVDTAGRLAVDEEMMSEIKSLHTALKPIETLFVVDAMTGQDAATTARTFNRALSLTGVILTKADGDARGGAALSVRALTNKPIKFMGTGEGMDGIEAFHPDRLASRILGMGDVLSLVEDAQRNVDADRSAKMVKRLLRGAAFTYEDMQMQLEQLIDMGGMSALMDRLPNMPNAKGKIESDEVIMKFLVIIGSMTVRERAYPNLLNMLSRKKRIAKGSGTQMQDVNALIRKFKQMQKANRKIGRMTKSKALDEELSRVFSQM